MEFIRDQWAFDELRSDYVAFTWRATTNEIACNTNALSALVFLKDSIDKKVAPEKLAADMFEQHPAPLLMTLINAGGAAHRNGFALKTEADAYRMIDFLTGYCMASAGNSASI